MSPSVPDLQIGGMTIRRLLPIAQRIYKFSKLRFYCGNTRVFALPVTLIGNVIELIVREVLLNQ